MSFPVMSAAEWTHPPRDYVPVTPGAEPLQFIARGLYCSEAGDVVIRCVDSDADRTLPMTAGQLLTGFVTHVKASTTATVFAVK